MFELEESGFEFFSALCGEAADAGVKTDYSIIKKNPTQRKNNKQSS